jgi:hypothetical protein
MADLDAQSTDDSAATTGAPRWVKAFAIVAIAVVLMLVVGLITGKSHGPGLHSPTRHTHRGGAASQTTPPTSTHKPPAGGHTPSPVGTHDGAQQR